MKAAGCCSVCGEECFEVLQYWPEHHLVYPGLPRRVGKPHADALRLTLVLVSGSLMNLTIKEQYLADFHLALPEVWRNVLQTTRTVRKGHRFLKQRDFTDAQNAEADQFNIEFNDNVPIGVLCWQRWSELQGQLDHGT